jgi:hypothetical protein
MPDANLRKLCEAGKASLEQYDVERTIDIVRELGEGLIEATAHSKHHFRREWLDQLIERYRRQPGKPIIRLDDLGDEVIPSLSAESSALLLPYWKSVVQRFGYNGAMGRFRCQRDIVATGRASRWSKLRNWRQFSELTGLRINDLEPYVVALRASNVGTSRVISNPKLPFNLATPAGAKIIGYRGDAAYKTSAFHNLEPILHEDYKQAITETIGGNPFTTTYREDGCNRTNVGVFVTMLQSIAGIDNTKRQKLARNPFPSWFFTAAQAAVTAGMRANWDAEGSPDKQLQLGQGVGVDNASQKLSTLQPKVKKPFSWLEEPAQTVMGATPPPLLVSTALLLYRLGIISYMSPQKVWRNKNSLPTVFWVLCIYRMRNMELFRDTIGFLSPTKHTRLEYFTNHSKSSSPSSPFYSERCD